MAVFYNRNLQYRESKEISFDWLNFKGGLNNFFKENEIKENELAQTKNIMLVGQGVPTKRWGTGLYFTSGATGSVRWLSGFYQKDGTNQLLTVNDNGLLTKKNNDSYTEIAGVSWASGSVINAVQLDNRMYFVSDNRELSRYSNPTLIGFATIGQPLSTFATQISGISGTHSFSYRLTHITSVGETAPAGAYEVQNQPETPSLGSVLVTWTNASSASGIRKGTNIYGRRLGEETFLAQVDGEVTKWIDDGTSVPQLFGYPPLADSTGGPIAKYIKRFKDRLVLSGINNDPTMVLISGPVPLHERFDFGSGGGYIRLEPDSGDNITGIEVTTDRIIVFKEKSIWQVKLSNITIGNFTLLNFEAAIVTKSVGCASHRSIVHVENDIVFLSKGSRGVFVVGYEPNVFADFLRTNELSIRIRPYFENLTANQEMNAVGGYFKNRYFLFFPGRNEAIIFDRERQAWTGPISIDAQSLDIYYDSNDKANLLLGKDNLPEVIDMSASYPGDEGTIIETILRTRKEDFKNWTQFKNIKNVFTRWRNVSGTIDVDLRLEGKTGNVLTAKSFTITTGSGNSGWGADIWANTQWGDTEVEGSARDLNELVKQAFLQKAARNLQLIIKTDQLNDNYELLAIRGEAQEIGPGFQPLSWIE